MKKFIEVNDFSHACELRGYNQKEIMPNLSMLPPHIGNGIKNLIELVIIIEAVNDGKRPNWNNAESKYYPWWDVEANEENTSGVGLSYLAWTYSLTSTSIGSRLSLVSPEAVEYVAKKFKDKYEQWLLFLDN